jgi:hypothetical protein
MFRCHADQASQLLTISYSQHVDADEMMQVLEAIRASLAGLQPGFRLLSDYAGLVSMDPACAPLMATIMDECTDKGVSEVHRVVPDPQTDIGLAVISAFHLGRQVHVVEHSSLEEAFASVG